MFKSNKNIARNSQTDLEDTRNIKFALTALGDYDDTRTRLSPYADDNLFESIKSFQSREGLKIDGIINSDGPTQEK